jgi:methylated-DNA-[protein]-cysteine S-methyltransferase
MTISTDREAEWVRTLRDTPSPPADLAQRIQAGVDRRRAEAAAVPDLDLTATEAGIACIRVGRGKTDAPTRAARRHAERAREELAQYFAGTRSFFTVPADLSAAGPFQSAVLRTLHEIPIGEVRPYGWVAERIGHPAAARAVGTALARNPVPVLLPCHRVVRRDGGSSGYAFGPELRRRLMLLERAIPALVGCSTTHVLCRRGCAHEQRMAEQSRIVFASVGEARTVGYRPCAVCRPQG